MTEQHERYANELEEALNEFSKNVNKILEKIFIFKGETKKTGKWNRISKMVTNIII